MHSEGELALDLRLDHYRPQISRLETRQRESATYAIQGDHVCRR